MASKMSLIEQECRLTISLAYAVWVLKSSRGVVTEDFMAYEHAIGLYLPF